MYFWKAEDVYSFSSSRHVDGSNKSERESIDMQEMESNLKMSHAQEIVRGLSAGIVLTSTTCVTCKRMGCCHALAEQENRLIW